MRIEELFTEVDSFSVEMQQAVLGIMSLSSKLVEAIPEDNESFLNELLQAGLKHIPEADYGSISVIDEESWRFAAAIGHDLKLLQRISLKPQYSLKFSKAEHSNSSNVYIIDDIMENDSANMPIELQKQLQQASKPIKQSIIAEIRFDGRCRGHICLDIALHSSKRFRSISLDILKSIADLASAYFMMKLTYSLVRNLENTVYNRTLAVRNLMDNIGQGLLSMGCDLLVHPDCSKECSRIFGQSIENKFFPQLIFESNKSEAKFLKNTLLELFKCHDAFKQSVYISLLPTEVTLKNRVISLEYKLVDNIYAPQEKAIIVVITDITEQKLLEARMQEEQQAMKMVANVVSNFDSFMECYKDFQYFYGSKLHEMLRSELPVQETFANLYREIHTFKGNFAQFEMSDTVARLNEMEGAFSKLNSKLDKLTRKELYMFVYSFDIIDFASQDIGILREKLGTQFFRLGDMVYVDKSVLSDIEKEIMTVCSPVECWTILPLIRKLKFRPLKDMLATYPDYAIKLAEKLEKPINVFHIEGDDILVDSDKYGNLAKVLVHLFRNSVDHGLETIDERIELGKSESGNIRCVLREQNTMLEILIEDDGSGIDFEKVRGLAVEKGLCQREQAAILDEAKLIDLLFLDSFTTKSELTSVSGRGMGLSAVKTEVEKLGGKVELHTARYQGTTFRLLIPLEQSEQKDDLDSESFIQPVLSTTLDFLQENLKEQLRIQEIRPFTEASFELLGYTAFINIRGIYDGIFVISMEKPLSLLLIQNLIYENVEEEAQIQYAKDVVAECANMILGNSIKAYPDLEEYMKIGTPNVVFSSGHGNQYHGNQINGYEMITDYGMVMVGIIQ